MFYYGCRQKLPAGSNTPRWLNFIRSDIQLYIELSMNPKQLPGKELLNSIKGLFTFYED